MIEQSTLEFLKEIKLNNNKIWFDNHKSEYLKAKDNMTAFCEELVQKLNKNDVIERFKVYRIYRDVRFSKDKTPYKTYLHAIFYREGPERRGSYYLGIEPGNSFAGGGFYGPEKDDLFRIRKEIEMNGDNFLAVVNDKKFLKRFGELRGEALKTSPKGFNKDDENIFWINKKQFYALKDFSDKEVCSKNFIDEVYGTFQDIRPFFDFMSETLTTNLDGESILKK